MRMPPPIGTRDRADCQGELADLIHADITVLNTQDRTIALDLKSTAKERTCAVARVS